MVNVMDSPVVQIEQGQLRGCTRTNLDGEKFLSFLGIPYAKPPLGELRFKAPIPAEPWSGVRDANIDGEGCVFRNFFTGGCCGSEDCLFLNVFTREAPIPAEPWSGVRDANIDGEGCVFRNFFTGGCCGSEDCLFLNVFTRELPKESNKLKPVMVYIHGGGFICESSNSQFLGPEHFMVEDIVFVTLNYRLGILGFLSSDDQSLGVTGNAGLKDQTLALQWVQKNIKNFNGDPDNVTIFGNSAGSTSVHLHVLSKYSEGLFHKAILQSGTVFNPWSWGSKNIMEIAKNLGKQVKDEKEALDVLKTTPVETLYEAQEKCLDKVSASMHRPFGPVLEVPNENAFITQQPVDIIRSGQYNKVPMIFGYNLTEGMFMEYNKMIFPQHPDVPMDAENVIDWQLGIEGDTEKYTMVRQKIEDFYWNSSRKDDKYMPFTDSLYVIGIYAAVMNHIKTTEKPIYLYRMSLEGGLNILKMAANLSHLPGVSHADELGYLFKNVLLPDFEPGSADDTYVRRFIKLWTNFARTGNPTSEEDFKVTWKPVDEEQFNLLDIGKELIPSSNAESEAERLNFWRELYQINPESTIFI